LNIALKIVLLETTSLAQVGLALATSLGAWINFGLIIWFGLRGRLLAFDAELKSAVVKLIAASLVLAAVLWIAQRPMLALAAGLPAHNVAALVLLAVIAALAYAAALFALFGRAWIMSFGRSSRALKPSSSPSALAAPE
ncbi:MAG: lipid II flippase MurJ, partial [Alphaproteobacteria bacterium]|nr:lipid II flippase MurJ [Alphaproteobacteria bacterium]